MNQLEVMFILIWIVKYFWPRVPTFFHTTISMSLYYLCLWLYECNAFLSFAFLFSFCLLLSSIYYYLLKKVTNEWTKSDFVVTWERGFFNTIWVENLPIRLGWNNKNKCSPPQNAMIGQPQSEHDSSFLFCISWSLFLFWLPFCVSVYVDAKMAIFSSRYYDCAHHDNHQHALEGNTTQDPLCQSHRHVPDGLLRLCLLGLAGVCLCQLYFLREGPSDAEKAGGKSRKGQQRPQ